MYIYIYIYISDSSSSSLACFSCNSSSNAIRTPFECTKAGAATQQLQSAPVAPSSEAEGSSTAALLSDQILSAAMTDPITMMYDAWWYLSSQQLQQQPPPSQDTPDSRQEQTTCSSDGTEHAQRPNRLTVSNKLLVWADVCAMHAISMLVAVLLLLPSVLNPSMLACNATIRRVNASTWRAQQQHTDALDLVDVLLRTSVWVRAPQARAVHGHALDVQAHAGVRGDGNLVSAACHIHARGSGMCLWARCCCCARATREALLPMTQSYFTCTTRGRAGQWFPP